MATARRRRPVHIARRSIGTGLNQDLIKDPSPALFRCHAGLRINQCASIFMT
jgi:hypothetical protein